MAHPQELLDAFQSLADSTRLRLLMLLESHELGVAELCQVLQMPQSTVSRHLKVLSDQGWIRGRSQKTANLYHMLSPPELRAGAAELWQVTKQGIKDWAELAHDNLRLEPLLRRHRSTAFFARAAQRWQAMRDDLYGRTFSLAALAALLPKEAVVADLACGTGELAALIAPNVAKLYGIDQSEQMLDEARGRTADRGNVELLHADLHDLPLPDACCDLALMLLALTYVEQPQLALREATRVLRPGGRAVIVTLLHHDREHFRLELEQLWPGFSPAQLYELMGAAGLNDITCRPLPPDPGAKGPALILASGIVRASER